MASDREDGGDGVDGEDDVGELDGDEGEQEDGDGGTAVLADDEVVLARADGVDALQPGDPAGGVPSGWLGAEGISRRTAAIRMMTAKT